VLSKNIKKCRFVTLTMVLYRCKTWSLTLKEGGSKSMFEKGLLRGVFGPKRDEVTGSWRNLHNEELIICTLCPVQV
jgi:hypothetical protein